MQRDIFEPIALGKLKTISTLSFELKAKHIN
jgi:hypothetical protein